MDSTSAGQQAAQVDQVGVPPAHLVPDLGKEVRESALLLGFMLVVLGLAAALASTSLLLG